MTFDQLSLFVIFFMVFCLFLWGKLRYDVVAFGALVISVLLGLVPLDRAFSGFGHPATIIVALVLIVSTGLVNSGAVYVLSKKFFSNNKKLRQHITLSGGVGAVLSAFMNNVATLALLMPADIQKARKSEWSPRATLMPLSFATILGGMITLIGTPPNIIVSEIRQDYLGQPYSMFDFSYVGIVLATFGLAYLSLFGWRFMRKPKIKDPGAQLMREARYSSELTIPADSDLVGKALREIKKDANAADVVLRGFIREEKNFYGPNSLKCLVKGDTLLLDATPDSLDEFRISLNLDFSDSKRQAIADEAEELSLAELVVTEDSRIRGKSSQAVGLAWRKRSLLLGVSRKGRNIRKRVNRITIKTGDVLLLLMPKDLEADVIAWLGCLPLEDRGLQVTQGKKLVFGISTFAAAVIAASLGLVYLPIALAITVIIFAIFKLVGLSEIYKSVEWPIIVLLGCMIPLGTALTESGGTGLIVNSLMVVAGEWPSWVILLIIMLVTMTLSDILNNTTTALIAAPVAIEVAQRLSLSPDPFLMAVAIAASCAFLTPIGHKNNTLIMGPGGYDFNDYWRMGLPLELLVVAIGIPAILFFWPM